MTAPKAKTRKPRAFKPGEVKIAIDERPAFAEPVEARALGDALVREKTVVADRRTRWGALFFAALTGLAGLSLSLWLGSFLDDLLSRQDWIGWLGLGLIGLLVFAAAMIVLREAWALFRLSRLGRLRQEAARALAHDDISAAADVTAD